MIAEKWQQKTIPLANKLTGLNVIKVLGELVFHHLRFIDLAFAQQCIDQTNEFTGC